MSEYRVMQELEILRIENGVKVDILATTNIEHHPPNHHFISLHIIFQTTIYDYFGTLDILFNVDFIVLKNSDMAEEMKVVYEHQRGNGGFLLWIWWGWLRGYGGLDCRGERKGGGAWMFIL
jgi:hypothetical protein